MKKIFLAAALAATLIAPAAFAGDKVKVEFKGKSRHYEFGDFKSTSYCQLKMGVASAFGLKMREFEIYFKNGAKVKYNKMLFDAGIREHDILTLKLVKRSKQCSSY